MPTRTLPADVVDALRRGNKIEAIKRLREATGLGLAEAKGVVDAHGDAAVGMSSPGTPHAGKSASQTKSASSGRSASQAMQAHDRVPLSRPGLSPGEVPRSSVPGVAIAIATALAAAALVFVLKG